MPVHGNVHQILSGKTFRAFSIMMWLVRLICIYTSYIHGPGNGFAFLHITNILKKNFDSSCARPRPLGLLC